LPSSGRRSPPRRFGLDPVRPLAEAARNGHNRWHPGIEPIATVAPGEEIVVETRDGGDGQITPESTLEHDLAFDLDRLHPLVGPFFVETAEPGDLLELEILEIEPGTFGWAGVWPGGGGLMRDFVDEPLIVKWTIKNGVARSPSLPGVRIRGAPFVGVMGVAPSPERLRAFREREATLVREGGWAALPSASGAVPPEAGDKGLRTMPPRETGGNFDVKDAVAGTRVTFPIDVPGALFSLGDLHFAQGDGESYGTAIEMRGTARIRLSVCKSDDLRWRPRYPTIQRSGGRARRESRPSLITTGLPIAPDGRNYYLDLNLAARAALNEMVDYLVDERGYTKSQAQVIVSVAADLRISVVNNPPNSVVAVALPLDIFEHEPPDEAHPRTKGA
jgi:formamidase